MQLSDVQWVCYADSIFPPLFKHRSKMYEHPDRTFYNFPSRLTLPNNIKLELIVRFWGSNFVECSVKNANPWSITLCKPDLLKKMDVGVFSAGFWFQLINWVSVISLPNGLKALFSRFISNVSLSPIFYYGSTIWADQIRENLLSYFREGYLILFEAKGNLFVLSLL